MATYVAVFALVLAYVALVAAYLALRTLAKVRRASVVLNSGGNGRESLLQASSRNMEWTAALAQQLESVRAELAATRAEIASGSQVDHGDLAQQMRRLEGETTLAFNSRDEALVHAMTQLESTLAQQLGRTDARVDEDLRRMGEAVAGELGRIDALVGGELGRLDGTVGAELTRLDALLSSELTRMDSTLSSELTRMDTTLVQSLGRMDGEVARSLRNVALVRFDAFDDMAGRLSFSLALLDDHGDGVTLTSLAGRADTRLYAKGVHAGLGEHDLSPEEEQAIKAACQSAAEHEITAERGAVPNERRWRMRRSNRQAEGRRAS